MLPTVVFSNHPGYRHHGGMAVAPAKLERMLAALEDNGLLDNTAAVLTGYLPTAAHVAFARRAAARIRKRCPSVLVVCDPVLGDDPGGLYIAEPAARALARTLLPEADVITPNRFELAWLSGREVTNAKDAIGAASALAVPQAVVTSVPAAKGRLETIAVPKGGRIVRASLENQNGVPHGVGDLFSALLTGYLLQGQSLSAALQSAHQIQANVVALSAGRGMLDLSPLTRIGAMP